MEFRRKYRIGAARLAVWKALNDADVLKETIPGCKKIAWTSETALDAEIAVNLGVAKPNFKGVLELSDVVPAQSYVLSGHGKGGLLGHASGSARITLMDEGEGTLLDVDAGGEAGGQIARLGATLLGGSVYLIMDRFFARFGEAMGADIAPVETAETEGSP